MTDQTPSTMGYLRGKLREVGAARWAELAAATGTSANTLRKIAYGDRTNPRIDTIEPLLNYFRAADGAREVAHG